MRYIYLLAVWQKNNFFQGFLNFVGDSTSASIHIGSTINTMCEVTMCVTIIHL
jgi:hypothetical protein